MQDPLDQLMNAICESGDEAASIIAIDAAIALGAMSDPAAEPLHYAAMGRRSQVIRHLYARGATLAAELPANGGSPFVGKSRGDTALHVAAEDRWSEGLELILSLDPCPKVAMAVYDIIQRTPLIIAANRETWNAFAYSLRMAPMSMNTTATMQETRHSKRPLEKVTPRSFASFFRIKPM